MAKDQSKSKNKLKSKKPAEDADKGTPETEIGFDGFDTAVEVTTVDDHLEVEGRIPLTIPEPGPTPEPEPEPELVEVVTAVGTRVAMRVYLAACSYRWDQMMGFKSYATTRKMGPLTMREWNEAYKDYLNRPVE